MTRRGELLAGLIFAACVGFASCAEPPASAPVAADKATVVQTICLPMKTYSVAQQNALADALVALPPSNPLNSAMADYGALRAADRACQANPK